MRAAPPVSYTSQNSPARVRRKGQAPASMGLSDDLAARLAYESLTSLSGMASKVQETIEHNRAAFANQVALIDRQVVQKAMFAWKSRCGIGVTGYVLVCRFEKASGTW
jgi:hypothetical protein